MNAVAPAPPPPKPIHISWFGEINAPASSWIVKGVLPTTGLAAIYGPSGSGKSFAALDLAFRIATGVDALGRRTQKSGVAYLAVESPDGVRKRIEAIRQHHPDKAKAAAFALVEMAADFAVKDAPDVGALAELLRSLDPAFADLGAPLRVVFVDTFARASPGLDESASRDMGVAIRNLERLVQDLSVLVVIIHHTGKDAERGMRGHSSLHAALDAILEIAGDPPQRTLTLVKAKDAPGAATWTVQLRPVTLGVDQDGDEITSCVVEFEEAGPTPARRPNLNDDQKIVLRAFVALASERAGQANCPGCPAPPSAVALDWGQVRDKALSLGLRREDGKDPNDATKKAWQRAIKRLIALRLVIAKDDWVWLTDFGRTQTGAGTN